MTVAALNAFCRRFDLIFVEMGSVKGLEVHWFVDFQNIRRFYTKDEIRDKMATVGIF